MSWWCLGASGVIGLTIGDQFLYRALVDAGPRISTLVMTVAPALLTALLAWPVLDEPLTWLAIIGMLLTLGGIAWVVVEREQDTKGRAIRIRLAASSSVCWVARDRRSASCSRSSAWVSSARTAAAVVGHVGPDALRRHRRNRTLRVVPCGLVCGQEPGP